MLNSRLFSRFKTRQRGAAAVEFGIIAVLFFTLFFGIVEFGRFFYLYNTVQEVTRCAARQATVKWTGDWDGIPQQCLFGHDELVAGWEIHAGDIHLRALNLKRNEANPGSIDDNISNCVTSPEDINCIRFVEASLWCTTSDPEKCDPITHRIIYQPNFGLIPWMSVNIPNSTVTMPAEGLGYTGT